MKRPGIVILSVLSLLLGLAAGWIHPAWTFALFLAGAALVVMTTNFTAALYLLSGYLLVDYLFRSILELSLLASIWDELFLLGCLVLMAIRWLTDKKSRSVTPVHVTLFLFFALNVFLLFVNATWPAIALEGVRAVVQHMLWFYIAYSLVQDKTDIRRVLLFLIAGVLLIALHGIYQYAVGVEMPAQWVDMAEGDVRTRAFSVLGGPNALGSVMVLVSPLALSMFFTARNRLQKVFFLISFAAMILCLLATLSRGAWIGFAIAILLFLFLYEKRALLPLTALGILLLTLIPPVSDRILYMLTPQYIYSSLTAGRLFRWEAGWSLFTNNLLLGVGPGHFGGAVAMRHPYYLGEEVFYLDNYYLKTAVELGLAGLVSYAILLWSLLSTTLKGILNLGKSVERTLLIGLFSGMAGVLTQGFVENVFEVPGVTVLFWMCAAFSMSLIYLPDSQTLQSSP